MMFEYDYHWFTDNKHLRTHLLFHLYLEYNTWVELTNSDKHLAVKSFIWNAQDIKKIECLPISFLPVASAIKIFTAAINSVL
jgi:hypothetical protein